MITQDIVNKAAEAGPRPSAEWKILIDNRNKVQGKSHFSMGCVHCLASTLKWTVEQYGLTMPPKPIRKRNPTIPTSIKRTKWR